MRKKVLVATMLTPLAVIFGPGLFGGADAAPANCQSGATCGFTGANYTGSYGNVFGDNSNLTFSPWTGVHSVWNNGNYCNDQLFTSTGWTGNSLILGLGDHVDSLSATYANNIRSNRWCV